MIRSALIYAIIDVALDRMFDQIMDNISPVQTANDVVMHVGDKYPLICVNRAGSVTYYFDCVITTINRNTVFFTNRNRCAIRTTTGIIDQIECENCTMANASDIVTME